MKPTDAGTICIDCPVCKEQIADIPVTMTEPPIVATKHSSIDSPPHSGFPAVFEVDVPDSCPNCQADLSKERLSEVEQLCYKEVEECYEILVETALGR